jgi:hypothetical protein
LDPKAASGYGSSRNERAKMMPAKNIGPRASIQGINVSPDYSTAQECIEGTRTVAARKAKSAA